MPTVVDLAVCLRQWDWSETSQTVSLFSREHGLVRAVAKGSRRQDPRFSGGLEVATVGEMVAILKPGPGLAVLTAWDLRETFPALRRSLSAFYAGMYTVDVAHHAVTDNDPHPALFDKLVLTLRALGGPGGARADRLAVLRLQWATLDETGYRPELDRDAATDAPLAPARSYTFVPRMGGFTTDPPPRDFAAEGAGEHRWRVRAETLRLLRAIRAAAPPAGGEGGEVRAEGGLADAPAAVVDRAARLLHAYSREVLGHEPASAPALFGPEPV